MQTSKYEQPAPNKMNQGIVDGRPEGANPPQAKVLDDTIIDTDASAETPAVDTSPLRGPESSATSQDVHRGLGHPGSDMSSTGRRRDQNEGQGVSQWGPPKVKDTELDRGQRTTGDIVGPTTGF